MKTQTTSFFVRISSLAAVGTAMSLLVACPVLPPEDLSVIRGSDAVEGGDSDKPQREVSSVTISGSTDLSLGGTAQLSIAISYTDGTSSADVNEASWYSTNADVVTVAAGNVSAVGAGSASIYAVAGGVASNYLEFSIQAKPVSTVVISGQETLTLGGTLQLAILITYEDSTTSTMVNAAAWYSTNSEVLTVSAGNLTAIGVGSASVYAVAGGVTSNYLEFTIQPAGVELDCGTALMAGSSTTCQLWGLNASSARITLIYSGWSMTATSGLVSVDGTYITAYGTSDGTETLNATYSGTSPELTDSTTIDVVHVNGLSIAVSGTCATTALVSGSTCTYTATPTRSSGGAVPTELVNSIIWTSPLGNNAIVTSSEGATGTIEARAIGAGNLRATLGTVQSNVIDFTTRPYSVVIPGGPFDVNEGGTQELTYQAFDTSSVQVSVLASATVTWVKASGSGFTIDAETGVVSGVTGSQSGTVTVTVNGVLSASPATINVVSVRQAPVFAGLQGVVLTNNNGTVHLTWNAATDAQTTVGLTYEIHYAENGAVNFGTAAQVTGIGYSTNYYDHMGVNRGSSYSYGVCARDADHNVECGTGSTSGPTLTVAVPRTNPAVANTVLYVTSARDIAYLDRTSPSTRVDLGSVMLGDGRVLDITAPWFAPDGRIIGIGQGRSNSQVVYARDQYGTLGPLSGEFLVSTGTRGLSAPGSAKAFALDEIDNWRIAYTKSGSSTDTVNLFVANANGAYERQAPLNDIERAAPTTDGKIAVIWYGNVYLLTPPANLAMSGQFQVRPLTTDSSQSGKLIFGRKAGTNDTVVTVASQASGTNLAISVFDITSGHALGPTESVGTAPVADMTVAGGFVESSSVSSLWDGLIVVQRYVDATHTELYEVDSVAVPPTITLLTTVSGASVDTIR